MQRCQIFLALIMILAWGCGGEKETSEPTSVVQSQPKVPIRSGTYEKPAAPSKEKTDDALLIATSEFKTDDDGRYTVPDAAVLTVLKQVGDRFTADRIEDRESNVFHKALPYGNEGILTIGGNAAMLKLWQKKGTAWQSKTLWHPTFGGKHNRLRDFEISDFNGDGTLDLAIATHDQGVVAVVWRRGDTWVPEELDRQADTFVHEIEIGDLDGDGKKEIYATPSQPNTVSGKDQGGKVVQFRWGGDRFEKSTVATFKTRHVKEILVADVDGDSKEELYAVIEAEVDGPKIKKPVEIQRFDLEGRVFKGKPVATLSDRYCRFLVAGDIDHDGDKELIAAAFSSGVWILKPGQDTYDKTCIDAKSGGFEHAAYIADLDSDGKATLFVADDRSGSIKQFDYTAGSFKAKSIFRRLVPGQAMVWNITQASVN